MAHVNHTDSSGVTSSPHNYPVDFNSNSCPLSLFHSQILTNKLFSPLPSVVRQPANREATKASPSASVLLLPVVPHVGETDTDTLTEIPDRPAEAEENNREAQREEAEDEFVYSWGEFTLYNQRYQMRSFFSFDTFSWLCHWLCSLRNDFCLLN